MGRLNAVVECVSVLNDRKQKMMVDDDGRMSVYGVCVSAIHAGHEQVKTKEGTISNYLRYFQTEMDFVEAIVRGRYCPHYGRTERKLT